MNKKEIFWDVFFVICMFMAMYAAIVVVGELVNGNYTGV